MNAARRKLEDILSDAAEALCYLGHRGLDVAETAAAWVCRFVSPELLPYYVWLVILSLFLLY